MGAAAANAIRVWIIEDDPEVSAHLSFIIGSTKEFNLAGTFSSAEGALAALENEPPDVALLDVHLPGLDGIGCAREMKRLAPATQILILTVYDDSERIFQALAAGASGYLLKRTSLTTLIQSIRDVHEGGSPFSSHIARKIVQYFQKPAGSPGEEAMAQLSAREREVLTLLAQGDMYKEIADKLGLALDTVRKHIRSIYEKLHVRSRTEAVLKFLGR